MNDQYAVCEAAVMNSVRTLTAFFEEAWQVTDNGGNFPKGASNFLLVKPGQFPIVNSIQKSIHDYQWFMTCELYVRFIEYEDAMAQFKATRWAIIERLSSDSTLGGTSGVYDVSVSSGGDVQFWYESERNDVPNFVFQILTVVVSQRVAFTKRW